MVNGDEVFSPFRCGDLVEILFKIEGGVHLSRFALKLMKVGKYAPDIVRVRWGHLLVQTPVIDNHSVLHLGFYGGRVINGGVHFLIRILGD